MAVSALPVNAPANVVVVNVLVLGRYVNPVSVSGPMAPVACVENIGYAVLGQVGLDVTWTF